MFKLICELNNSRLMGFLKRFRLYHPSLQRFRELSKGSPESLIARSREFGDLLQYILIHGVCKRTGLGRLIDLDKWLGSIISDSVHTPFIMLDVGASDGSTTFDTVRYLRNQFGIDVNAYIIEMQLRIHSFRRGCLRYYLTHDWSPWLLQIGPVGVLFEETSGQEGCFVNPVVRSVKKWIKVYSLERHFEYCGDILLESPLVKACPDIHWFEQDLFQYDPSLVGTFDLIRCSNVLNCGYFCERQICNAVDLLTLYLKPNGLLLVSRTVDNLPRHCHTASLWSKTGAVLDHIADFNGGSEVKSMVLVSKKKWIEL